MAFLNHIVLSVPDFDMALSMALFSSALMRVLNMTPAQAAGVESSAWTVAELLERCGE